MQWLVILSNNHNLRHQSSTRVIAAYQSSQADMNTKTSVIFSYKIFCAFFSQLMNVLPLPIVLKILIVLTLPMALSVSVHLGSWVMEQPVVMAALLINVQPSLIVLKMPRASILLLVLSVSVHLGSWVMGE